MQLNRTTIHQLFKALNAELKSRNLTGELCLVGGAVMCLAFQARNSTADVDAVFAPTAMLREAAARVGHQMHVNPQWLNDGVKGFLSPKGDFSKYLDLSHLKISVATPGYMLAMKCMAARIGEEFHDIDDIRYLLRHMGVETIDAAYEIISQYYALKRLPQKSVYVLQELLE